MYVDIKPANIYLFKVNNRNTRKRCEMCSKLKTKTLEDVNDVVLVFQLLTLNISSVPIVNFEQVNVSWVLTSAFELLHDRKFYTRLFGQAQKLLH